MVHVVQHPPSPAAYVCVCLLFLSPLPSLLTTACETNFVRPVTDLLQSEEAQIAGQILIILYQKTASDSNSLSAQFLLIGGCEQSHTHTATDDRFTASCRQITRQAASAGDAYSCMPQRFSGKTDCIMGHLRENVIN